MVDLCHMHLSSMWLEFGQIKLAYGKAISDLVFVLADDCVLIVCNPWNLDYWR